MIYLLIFLVKTLFIITIPLLAYVYISFHGAAIRDSIKLRLALTVIIPSGSQQNATLRNVNFAMSHAIVMYSQDKSHVTICIPTSPWWNPIPNIDTRLEIRRRLEYDGFSDYLTSEFNDYSMSPLEVDRKYFTITGDK